MTYFTFCSFRCYWIRTLTGKWQLPLIVINNRRYAASLKPPTFNHFSFFKQSICARIWAGLLGNKIAPYRYTSTVFLYVHPIIIYYYEYYTCAGVRRSHARGVLRSFSSFITVKCQNSIIRLLVFWQGLCQNSIIRLRVLRLVLIERLCASKIKATYWHFKVYLNLVLLFIKVSILLIHCLMIRVW